MKTDGVEAEGEEDDGVEAEGEEDEVEAGLGWAGLDSAAASVDQLRQILLIRTALRWES